MVGVDSRSNIWFHQSSAAACGLPALCHLRRKGLCLLALAALLASSWACGFVEGPGAVRASRSSRQQPQRLRATKRKKQELVDLEDFDAWEVLDLPVDADKKRIRRRFRKLVATQHPDKRPNDPNAQVKFMRIKKAYEELMGADSTLDEMKQWAEQNREWSESAREFLGEEEDTTPPEAPPVLYIGLVVLVIILAVGTYASLQVNIFNTRMQYGPSV
eukprot:TRINITY_DN100324_c0_g1_i1.p1 TRINITY_DN100324_c0_g1~~TRINITY_DN100324_c0_g1_i1.p1  ORF type:complete len:217 (+),score=37.36 TRINITY_DN100324_c0_g1_i1:151-801(+)